MKKHTTKYLDWIVAISFVLMLVVRFLTMFYMAHTAEISGQTIEQVSTVYESNPVAKLLINTNKIVYVITSVALPAFGVALYIFLRKRVDPQLLGFYVNFVFFVVLINVLSDGGTVLGRLL